MKKKKKKSIAHKYSRDFELLAFIAVKHDIENVDYIIENLTDALNDGGYDGEFIYSMNSDVLKTLLEAKLRSDNKADLPLNDFAKALVVAITKCADDIYIVTNLHFSTGTIEKLSKFSQYSGLQIKLYNGYSVNKFIRENRKLLNGVSNKLLEFLSNSNFVTSPQNVQIPPTEKLSLSENGLLLLDEYEKISNILKQDEQILLVSGEPYAGKSYYIKNFVDYLDTVNTKVETIDMSKFITYKQFFLELLEKSFGLTFELIDSLSTESFNEAFAQVGIYKTDKKDIKTLKFIFSQQDSIKYDYSVVFQKISNIYQYLLMNQLKKTRVRLAFLNLSIADEKVLQLFLYILKTYKFSCILEITENEYRTGDINNWNKYKDQFLMLSTLSTVYIKKWEFQDQKDFLQSQIPALTDEQCQDIVNKFGGTPKDLTKLMETMSLSRVFSESPEELIYLDIINNNLDKADDLDRKCLEWLQINNSYMIYIYVFLIIFNGKIAKDFIKSFKNSTDWLQECCILINKSHLFELSRNTIGVSTLKALNIIKRYYKDNYLVDCMFEAAEYTKQRINLLELPRESLLEIKVNLSKYLDQTDYISLLIELGESYLRCEQQGSAKNAYRSAYKRISKGDLSVRDREYFQIMLGLIKTSIWNAAQKRKQINGWIVKADRCLASITDTDVSFLKLKINFYLLCYRFNHSLKNNEEALSSIKKGIGLIEAYNMYKYDLPLCGMAWRFYAIAEKENTQSIDKCLEIFEIGSKKCNDTAKFKFGYIIHKNMQIKEYDFIKRLQQKLENYKPLMEMDNDLAIEEYLHYRVNVAALLFNLKEYDKAWELYEELLQKSAIFQITREEIRILNDMANIEWIRMNTSSAEKKYKKAIKIAKKAGYPNNYWPILVNLISLQLYNNCSIEALKLHDEFVSYFTFIGQALKIGQLAFETSEYYKAAIIIHLKNMTKIFKGEVQYNTIKDIVQKCYIKNIFQISDNDDINVVIEHLTLKDTMYEHALSNGDIVYLLKD